MHIEEVYKLWEMKGTSSSGISKTIHYNGSRLLLFGKKKTKSFEISYE